MYIVSHRKIFYSISAALVVLSIFSIFFFGLEYGIDFKGGSLIEVSYTEERPDIEIIKEGLGNDVFRGYTIRPTGDRGFIVRTPYLDNDAHQEALSVLSGGGAWSMQEIRFDSIGPSVGAELRGKALMSIGLVILAIVLFIAFVFRKVSEPVSSWKYGLIAIVALIHDVIIPTGAFAFLGGEIDTLFVTALLVILGFSIHDTIVVFDRVREHLRVNKENKITEVFFDTVGKSIAETFNRSINTSLTTLLVLVALYFFGSDSTQNFSLALIIGIAAGTYSSIFLASPLLVTIEKWSVSAQTRRDGQSAKK